MPVELRQASRKLVNSNGKFRGTSSEEKREETRLVSGVNPIASTRLIRHDIVLSFTRISRMLLHLTVS